MITARGLAKRYGDRRVFAGLDVDLPEGGFLLVTGPNGSGKTTLLRVLARPRRAERRRAPSCPSASRSATSATSRSSIAS